MRGLLDAEETNKQYQDRSEPAKSTVKPSKESKNAGDVRARRSALDNLKSSRSSGVPVVEICRPIYLDQNLHKY
jgi:hypothetical protein